MSMKHKYLMSALFVALAVSPAMAQVGIFDQSADWGPRGSQKVAGSASFSNDVYTLEGNGDDIWNNDDEGYFIYTEQSGSWTLSGEFDLSEPGGNEWAKFGPMIRAEGDAAGSVNYYAALRGALDLISPQWRPTAGAASASHSPRIQDSEGNQVAPDGSVIWLSITRVAEADDVVFIQWSRDGEEWFFGHSTQLVLPETVAYGIAITNHDDNDVLARGTASNVEFTQFDGVTVLRSFGADAAIEGNSVDVTLTVAANAAAVTLTETLPEGWTATDISDGGTADGNVITWELTDASTEVSYTAEIPVETEASIFQGQAGGVPVFGDNQISVLQQGIFGFEAHGDIGPVGLPGFVEEFDDSTVIIGGSGADIWGTADQFHFLFSEIEGAFTIKGNVQVFPLDGEPTWTKGGFMVRDNLTPGSPNVYYGPRSDAQIRHQTRLTQGVDTGAGGFLTLDQQNGDIELHRVGDTFNLYYLDLDGNRQFYDSVTVPMSEPVYVGIAITSHDNTAVSEVWAENVELIEHPFLISRSLSQTTVSPGDTLDINITVLPREGENVDISIEEMIPDGFSVESTSASSGDVSEGEGTVSWSLTGAEGEQTLTISLGVSGTASALSTLEGTFDDGAGYSGVSGSTNVVVELLSDYGIFQDSQDVGGVAAPGFVTKDGETWQVIGSGADIWGTADQMHYLWQQVSGDFTISVDNPYIGAFDVSPSSNDWQKMGLMARQSLDANSAYAYAMLRSSDQAYMLQWRDSAGIDAAWTDGSQLAADLWNPLADGVPGNNTSLDDYTPGGTIQLVREGDTFTANYIIDGDVFYNFDHDVVMTDPIFVGIAVTSHENGNLSQGRFDNPQLEGETVSVNGWMLY